MKNLQNEQDGRTETGWGFVEKPVERLTGAVCPTMAVFALLGGHWTVPILYRLDRQGPTRPGELERSVPGISRKEMHRRLDELVAAGIVERTVFAVMPPRVEYSITPAGRELLPAVRSICAWAEKQRSGRATGLTADGADGADGAVAPRAGSVGPVGRIPRMPRDGRVRA